MRDGVLLAEHSPSTLMVSQGCDSLEEAFLLLSQKQEVTRTDDADVSEICDSISLLAKYFEMSL